MTTTIDDDILITDADLEEEEDAQPREPTGPVGKKNKATAKADGPAPKKKKSSPPKVTPIILKQRKEVVEKRIQQLDVRLNRDKGLLQRYEDSLAEAEAALEAVAKAVQAEREIVDEGTRDAVVV